MQYIRTLNLYTDTLQEQELFDTVEGSFLTNLESLFIDLKDLERGNPGSFYELRPAINCINKMIYAAAGEKEEDLAGVRITEDPEEAADAFCKYLKKWILKIPNFTDGEREAQQ